MNCYQKIAMMGKIGYDSNVPRQHRETPVQEMRGDDRMNEKLTITWLGHSCFKVESGGYSVVFDPYADGKVPGLKPLRIEADEVLCSHEHSDHNFREAVTLRNRNVASPFRIQEISTYHDEKQGDLRGKSTIHILDDGVFRIAHMGDLGCELPKEQREMLKDLDVLMIPVGGYYTIDAAQARQLVEYVTPNVVIPMHDRGMGFGFDVLGSVNEYLGLCQNVVRYQNVIEITKDMPRQTAAMTF